MGMGELELELEGENGRGGLRRVGLWGRTGEEMKGGWGGVGLKGVEAGYSSRGG